MVKRTQDRLTVKQEKFANLVASGVDHSNAYRQTYSCDKMKLNTIHRKAHEESKHPKIQARVDQLRKPSLEKVSYTFEQHMADLKAAAKAATEAGQHSAAVRAIELLGKVSGFYTNQVAVTQHLVVLDD